jgi:hypothetical protein
MRKFSLLFSALGGAMAGYLFSNSKLREELADAKDAEAAGKILAKHLQKDGKQLGTHVKHFVDSDDVQKNVSKAKDAAKKYMAQANEQMKSFMKMSKKKGGAKKAGGKSEKKAA